MSDAQTNRTRDLGVLALAVIAPIWGYSWVVSKVGLDYAEPFTFIACLAYSALLAKALCWGLWVFALRALPAGAAGMGTLAVPVIGVTASWLQLGERPGAVEALGMAAIVGALAVLAAHGVAVGRRGRGPAGEELAAGGRHATREELAEDGSAIPPVID